MRVYHSPGSRSTRVVWTLEEIGAPYELVTLTLEERRGPEHRTRHPLGRVPLLELDDGSTMFESAAICLYLGDLFPEAGVVPPVGSVNRPALYQWLFFAMTELEPTISRWAKARREEENESEHAERFAELAPLVRDAIGAGPWVFGEDFSIVDVIFARVINIAFDRGLTDDYDDLRAYVARAFARPAHSRAAAAATT